MATLEELKRENARLKNIQDGLNDLKKIQVERAKLLKSNKQLKRNIKYGKVISLSKSIGKKSSTQVAKAGKGVWKGLQRYGKYLEEQERKQKALNKKLRTVKRKTKKTKTRKRRK